MIFRTVHLIIAPVNPVDFENACGRVTYPDSPLRRMVRDGPSAQLYRVVRLVLDPRL